MTIFVMNYAIFYKKIKLIFRIWDFKKSFPQFYKIKNFLNFINYKKNKMYKIYKLDFICKN